MIVVEGCDLVGKTTLVKALLPELEKRGYPRMSQHFGPLPENWKFVGSYLDFVHLNVVMDRFHLSELAYRHTLKDKASPLCPQGYELVDSKIAQMGGIVVVVVAKPDVIRKRFDQSRELFTLDQVMRVAETFETIAARREYVDDKNRLFRVKIDMTVDTTNSIDAIVKAIVQKYESNMCAMGRLTRKFD